MNGQESFKERALSPSCWYSKHGECILVMGCACACHTADANRLSKRYIGG